MGHPRSQIDARGRRSQGQALLSSEATGDPSRLVNIVVTGSNSIGHAGSIRQAQIESEQVTIPKRRYWF